MATETDIQGNGVVHRSSSHSGSIAVKAQERAKLFESIRTTYSPRRSVDFGPVSGSALNLRDGPRGTSWTGLPPIDGEHSAEEDDNPATWLMSQPPDKRLHEPPRDHRDEARPLKAKMASAPDVEHPSPFTRPPIDFDGLSWPSLGTRERREQTQAEAQVRLEKLAGAVRTILECVGEDPDREGLLNTPMRYARAMMYFTKGYEESVRELLNGAVFHEDHDELVIVKDIEVFSLCEHHLVPFSGRMHIGYIPNRRVVGLSKLARLAEMFSRRLQVQERLTKQVAMAVEEVLNPRGVAVVMESSHLCMVMRGVQKTSSSTTTSCMLGAMRNSAKTREEFLSLLKLDGARR